MFRAPCAHHQEAKIALHSLWYHHTYRRDDTRGCVMQFWPPGDEHMCSKYVEAWNIAWHSLWYHHTYRRDDTRGCVMQFWPPGDEYMCSKHVQAWNKLIVKQNFCAWIWLITETTSYSLLWWPSVYGARYKPWSFWHYRAFTPNRCWDSKLYYYVTNATVFVYVYVEWC